MNYLGNRLQVTHWFWLISKKLLKKSEKCKIYIAVCTFQKYFLITFEFQCVTCNLLPLNITELKNSFTHKHITQTNHQ